ncbi:MAG: DUF1134 domain-containing protein [Deltaproteobacteria bacterium]|nr:DUF1134 domain-containing protein [Deltaproteobacteria bacterium]
MTRKLKLLTLLLAVVFALSFSTAIAADNVPSSGTVKISGGSFALGIGWSWGSGHLNYKGREYPFRISGLKIIDLGGSSWDAVGEVYHMKDLADFEGTFIGGGAAGQTMKNENGVVMNLRSTKVGLQITLAPGGLKVSLK